MIDNNCTSDKLMHVDGRKPRPFSVAIVKSLWLREYTNAIASSCALELSRSGFDVSEYDLPTSLSLSYGIRRLAKIKTSIDFFIAMAIIVRGETRHADYIVQASLSALSQTMEDINKPILCEIICADSIDKILSRTINSNGKYFTQVSNDVMSLFRFDATINSIGR